MIPDFETREALNIMVQKIAQYSLSDQRLERGIFLEDRLIGFVNEVEIKDSSMELGYVIHPSFWGRGYATEMLNAMIRMLFEDGFWKLSQVPLKKTLQASGSWRNAGCGKPLQKRILPTEAAITTVFITPSKKICVIKERNDASRK